MILNMDRMVGTITPKKVFSCRGSLLGVPWLESDVAFDSVPHTAEVIVRPHTPEVIRGVRSFDMAAQKSFQLGLLRGNRRQVSNRHTVNFLTLLSSDMQFSFFTATTEGHPYHTQPYVVYSSVRKETLTSASACTLTDVCTHL